MCYMLVLSVHFWCMGRDLECRWSEMFQQFSLLDIATLRGNKKQISDSKKTLVLTIFVCVYVNLKCFMMDLCKRKYLCIFVADILC